LRPGMTATAHITVKKIEDALLVPNVALRFTPPVPEKKKSVRDLAGMLLPTPPGGKGAPGTSNITKEDGTGKVWRLKDDHLVPVSVTVGATDETWTEILKGDLDPGMVLAVDVLDASQ
jgi:HlyD family secretion protein